MKWILIIALLISIIGTVFYVFLSRTSNEEKKSTQIAHSKRVPTTTLQIPSWPPENSTSVNLKNQTYRIYYFPVTNKSIQLIPNYERQKSASSLVKENGCVAAINGGFYKEDYSPLGLLKINNTILNREVTQTNLITGFIWLNQNGMVTMGATYPDSAPTVLQTGPLIRSEKPLSITNDKQARRSALIQTNADEYYFTSVTFDKSTTSGPFLADLPQLLFSEDLPFQSKQAINLDGGTASYFYIENDVELSELTSIGSLFCLTLP